MSDLAEVPNLGPFVLVQAAVGIAIVGLTLFAMYKGITKDKSSGTGGVKLYFDGPLSKVLGLLEGIYRVSELMRETNNATIVEFRGRHEQELDLLRAQNGLLTRLVDILTIRHG